MNSETRAHATRKTLYREARRQLTRLLRKRWRGTRTMLRSVLRSLLGQRDRGFLLRVIRDHAFALALAAALVTGASVKAAPAIELADVRLGVGGFALSGIDAGDYSGESVAGVGDVNGDGVADFIVGASGADPDGKGAAGESYVVFGKAGGGAVELSDVASGLGGFVLKGNQRGDFSGQSVSAAGDVNLDGFADLIVGAPGADPDEKMWAGESYVVFGKADGVAVELSDVAAGLGGFVLKGADEFDYSGASVSGAGDVNGDGFADVVVGAPYTDESYVVFGKADTEAVELSEIRAGLGGFVLRGDSRQRVSGAGDVNGDGLADVIVGARYSGRIYVVFGKADGTAVELSEMRAGLGGFVLDDMEGSVSGAGDVNGDGLADLVVGARRESYVIFGKTAGTAVERQDIEDGVGGFVVRGFDNYGYSSVSVSGAGDMNGDGLADLIVGASNANHDGRPEVGESYVVFGKADGAAVELSEIASGRGGFVLRGIDPGDDSGQSVSGLGDVNGDGLADLIVGAPSADPDGKSRAGESYVVFGFGLEPVRFIRADANADGKVNIADPSFIANFVFGVGAATPPPCHAAADANGDGRVNIADPSYVANFLFGVVGAPAPPAPYPDCGLDVDRALTCFSSPGCVDQD